MKYLICSFLFNVFLASQAQSVPNLSGEWKLNAAKSDYGGVPAPEVMTRTIKHNEPSWNFLVSKGRAGRSHGPN